MLAGSMGMLPSASLGTRETAHGLFGLYEPIHGSAPDIAGQNKANPIAAILSTAMMLRHSFNLKQEAQTIETAVERVIEAGYRTVDLQEPGKETVDTKEMGRLIAEAIIRLSINPSLPWDTDLKYAIWQSICASCFSNSARSLLSSPCALFCISPSFASNEATSLS